jgi:hypothetical protein
MFEKNHVKTAHRPLRVTRRASERSRPRSRRLHYPHLLAQREHAAAARQALEASYAAMAGARGIGGWGDARCDNRDGRRDAKRSAPENLSEALSHFGNLAQLAEITGKPPMLGP